jgi:hypothetical protein
MIRRQCIGLALAATATAFLAIGEPAQAADARVFFVLEDGTYIRDLGAGRWAEYNAGGGLRRQLKEVARNAEFIEMSTAVPQALSVRLYKNTSTFKLHAPGGAWQRWKAGVWKDVR